MFTLKHCLSLVPTWNVTFGECTKRVQICLLILISIPLLSYNTKLYLKNDFLFIFCVICKINQCSNMHQDRHQMRHIYLHH